MVAILSDILKKLGVPQVSSNSPVKSAKERLMLHIGSEVYKVSPDPDALLPYIIKDRPKLPTVSKARVRISAKTEESLIWRRMADLHVLVASTFGVILGWKLYKEGITDIFQQEEGRECCGLMLTVFWLLLCRHSGRSSVGSVRICTAVGITVFPFITWIYYYINTELKKHWPEHCTTAL
ncbi:transmembrane protein 220 [Labeo rohita]|uniref:Transmembrane protein 220 n=1 Tax=Labeo rohita TaxID=84645 RepID=A0A498M5Z5_LABRO|nr:transmembrane protein 220 [Labeo rohita]